jgi:phage-related protein
MMADVTIQFGDYVLPNTINTAEIEEEARIADEKTPGADGVYVSDPPKKDALKITVSGLLVCPKGGQLRDKMDVLKKNCNVGSALNKLYLETDRYIWAQVNSFTSDFSPGRFQSECQVEIEFFCPDPFFYSDGDLDEDVWTGPVTETEHVFKIGGTADGYPVIEVELDTASGTTADLSFALEDQAFTLNGEIVDGDIIVIDSEAETVTLKADGSDKMSLFDGVFPSFTAGDNTLYYEKVSGDPVAASITTKWRKRWH